VIFGFLRRPTVVEGKQYRIEKVGIYIVYIPTHIEIAWLPFGCDEAAINIGAVTTSKP